MPIVRDSIKDKSVSFLEELKFDTTLDKRIFRHGQTKISIEKKDCFSLLESLNNEIDVIVTDPAYSGMNNKLKLGKGRIVGKYERRGSSEGKWFGEFEDSVENYGRFLAACRDALKDSGHIYIMLDSFSLLSLGGLIREYFDVKNVIVWDKVNMGMGHYFRRKHEFIIFATNKNNRKIKHRSFPDVWRFKRIHNSVYPTQKPVEIFQAMIYASAENGFTVCDPFMGSGSSAVAAIKNKCNFIGGDIAEKAFSISSHRIASYLEMGGDILQKKSANIDGEKIFWE
ncbi:site-specific DNA-methyltransferase [Patescibacteria group bacterium]|nr:site-specific DNA-methyltransferase [Patescibacteria group bacterium]